jgi:uncharacterized protein with GYD domain
MFLFCLKQRFFDAVLSESPQRRKAFNLQMVSMQVNIASLFKGSGLKEGEYDIVCLVGKKRHLVPHDHVLPHDENTIY